MGLEMPSVQDLFYGDRESVWIVPPSATPPTPKTPQTTPQQNHGSTSNSNTPATAPKSNAQTPVTPATVNRANVPTPVTPATMTKANVQTPSASTRGTVPTPNTLTKTTNQMVEMRVPICCEACEERVTNVLVNTTGVINVKCDTEKQKVTITSVLPPADLLKVCKKIHKRSDFWKN